MLHIWMEQNVLFYGMIGAGILGILCMFMVDRFYGRAIRDVRRITEPKGKWTKEFLNQYQMRLTKEQEINNPEAFVRTQLARGKTLGIGIQKWKQGIGYSAVLCFLLILTAVYGTYRYEQAQLLRYEYVLTGAGIFALLLLMKQFMGFMNKEDMILDGLLDYMENPLPARKPVPDEQALKEQTREDRHGQNERVGVFAVDDNGLHIRKRVENGLFDLIFVQQHKVLLLLHARSLDDLLLGIALVALHHDHIDAEEHRQRAEKCGDHDREAQKSQRERGSSPPAPSVSSL